MTMPNPRLIRRMDEFDPYPGASAWDGIGVGVVIGVLEGPFTYNDTGAQFGREKLPPGSPFEFQFEFTLAGASS